MQQGSEEPGTSKLSPGPLPSENLKDRDPLRGSVRLHTNTHGRPTDRTACFLGLLFNMHLAFPESTGSRAVENCWSGESGDSLFTGNTLSRARRNPSSSICGMVHVFPTANKQRATDFSCKEPLGSSCSILPCPSLPPHPSHKLSGGEPSPCSPTVAL